MPRFGAQHLEVTLLGRHRCTINSLFLIPRVRVACLFLGVVYLL